MGSRGGSQPTGLKGRETRTLFLRAPYIDWPALAQGRKTEFRTAPIGAISAMVHAPTPVVLYTVSPRLGHRAEMLVILAEHTVERLVDIADKPESLAREGHESYDSFRRYWRIRTKRPYRPLSKVAVFTLAPWSESEKQRLGSLLIDRLYGEYYPR
jgi:hypothetical protein